MFCIYDENYIIYILYCLSKFDIIALSHNDKLDNLYSSSY